ncbi:hypothetical protein BG000_008305 [Podila horticola]|nr:hypothetical protein BG000_008305 [Podila horticola]
MERDKSTSDKVTFNLYDTPGLNDTTLFDEKTIASIFNALEKEKTLSINLVVITVANNPFTEDLQNALKANVDLLPDLNGNIVFVHTRIDYSKLHPDEESFVLTLTEKKRILHELMGRDTVPHVLIDNDIGSTRVIRNCITQNILRELLAMAKLNRPVSIENKVVNKTEKMKIVDAILQETFHDGITRQKEVLGQKKVAWGEALSNVADLKAEIVKHEQDLEIIKRELSFHERDGLVLLYEERYDQAWSMMKSFNPEAAMYYPGKALESLPGFINHTLDYIDIEEHNVEVIQQVGGISERYWAVRFLCQGSQNGTYHVKLYITREKMYRVYIENLRTKENAIKETLAWLKIDFQQLETEGQELPKDIQELVDDLELHMYLLGRVSSKQLLLEDFQAMTNEDVYVREDSVSAANLQKFYLKKRLEEKSRLRASLLDQVDENTATPSATAPTETAAIAIADASPEATQAATVSVATEDDLHAEDIIVSSSSVAGPIELTEPTIITEFEIAESEIDVAVSVALTESDVEPESIDEKTEVELPVPVPEPVSEPQQKSMFVLQEAANPEERSRVDQPSLSLSSLLSDDEDESQARRKSIGIITETTLEKVLSCQVPSPPVIEEDDRCKNDEPPSAAQETPTADLTRPKSPERPSTSKEDKPQYSILMFGRTQAGKSKFIEFAKEYADPDYNIDWTLIGNNVVSKTGDTKNLTITSDFPTYEVCHMDSNMPIDTEALCHSCADMDDYEDAINNRKTTLKLAEKNPKPLSLGSVTIQVLDTPGINDTNYRDMEYSHKIIKEMVGIQSFNLIVVIVKFESAITQEQQVAFNYYSRVIHALQGNHSNVVFVYTHVAYKCRHHTNTAHRDSLGRQHGAFSCLFHEGAHSSKEVFDLETAMKDKDGDKYPHYTIDLDERHRPICRYMMQQTLRDILQLATTKPAVPFDISHENLDRVWAIKHPDEKNIKRRQKERAIKQADEMLRQKREAVGKQYEPLLLDDYAQAVNLLKTQTVEYPYSDKPDWLHSVFMKDAENEGSESDED